MVFEKELAETYDLIYKDKDYGGETDFVEEIFRNFSSKPVETILDGGCGTGGHAMPLAQRGYQVTGIDASEAMIKRAREKANKAKLNIGFQTMDIRQLDLKQKFDACLFMFSVLGYITETGDILKTLAKVKRHLKKDSLFIFDCWNGLAVMRVLPSARVQTFEDKDDRVIKIATPELDAFHHICRVNYQLIRCKGNTIISEFKETHIVRYFFPQEIIHFLDETGFEVLKICPFLDLKGKVDENVWNIAVIARAK